MEVTLVREVLTFRIRRNQLDWFNSKTRRNFVQKIAVWLEEAYPECVAGLARADLEGWVDGCVTKAESYGIELEPEVVQFILLFMILGADADERLGWVNAILVDRDLVGIGKVRSLVRDARRHAVAGIESVVLEEAS